MISFSDNPVSSPLIRNAEHVESCFKDGGWLESALKMEFRPQQTDMAIHVVQSMIADTPLAFEAGTGVGKSLAYLIPGLLTAVASERKMIVSSHTISLQEQILKKDLETCRELFKAVPELQKFVWKKT